LRGKAIVTITLMAFVFFLMVGCGNNSADVGNEDQKGGQLAEQGQTEQGQELNRLDVLKQAFKDAGFEVGENEVLAFEMLHASAGMKFTLDGELIEIYEYDMANLSDEASDIVEQAKKGSIDFMGFNVPAKFKDGLMMTRHNEHSQGEKIIEVFENF